MNSKSIVTPQPTEVSFSSSFSKIPSSSIYSSKKECESITESVDVGSWVTVIGVIPGCLNEVIKFFSKYGTIIRVDDTAGNWVYLEFVSLDVAKSIVSNFENGPKLINNRMAVTCSLGRIKSRYFQDKEVSSQFDFSFKPLTSNDNQISSDISGKIFDKVKGQ